MRFIALLLLAPLLASCSTKTVSTHNFPGWSLNDFNPFRHAPPVVQVHEETLQNLPQDQIAYQPSARRTFHRPVDFVPPTLPSGGLTLDGSLLPSKDAGFQAVFDVEGDVPDAYLPVASQGPSGEGQGFSIE